MIFFYPAPTKMFWNHFILFNKIYSLILGDVLTGDSNGNVFIWGRGYNAVTKALRNVHEGPIFSICVLKDGSIVTGGGKDRKMVQFDSTYRKSGLEATVRASYWFIWIWDFRMPLVWLQGWHRDEFQNIFGGNFGIISILWAIIVP